MTIRLLAQQNLGNLIVQPGATPLNNPPVWTTQPAPIFTEGTASNYELDDLVSDSDPITVSLNTGTASLPTGVTWNDALDRLEYDGAGAVTTTTGHIATANDGSDVTNSSSFSIVIQAADELVYPLTYSSRGANRNFLQDDALSATDRKAIGLLDACHTIGYDSGTQADTTPPASGYLARTAANQEILDANPANEHYLCVYHNITEAFDHTNSARAAKIKNYLESLDGPGSDDGWAYDGAGNKVVLFSNPDPTNNQYTINLSDHVAPLAGLTYPEWYADEIVKKEFVDVHVAAGVPVGGAGAVNVMLDNFQHHSNKSGIDWNNAGGNDDAQDYYDSEEPSHVAADPVATNAYSEVRANMRKGVERWEFITPGLLTLVNTNQWADDPADRSIPEDVANLRNCILEFRLNGQTDQAFVKSGFSENNSGNSFPRSGVNNDGNNSGQFGSWERSYANMYQSARLAQFPKIIATSWQVQCLQSGSTGAGGVRVYPNVPASNAVWHMARWSMVSAWLAGCHSGISGIQVGSSTAGRGSSTPLFDEYGLINGSIDYNGFGTGSTKLYRKWMGSALEDPPTAPKADGSWQREFTNALIVLNPDNDEANSPITVDVSAFPGGASEWKRFNGDQDSSTNNGTDASSDFSLDPIDAIVLVRKSWYDAL